MGGETQDERTFLHYFRHILENERFRNPGFVGWEAVRAERERRAKMQADVVGGGSGAGEKREEGQKGEKVGRGEEEGKKEKNEEEEEHHEGKEKGDHDDGGGVVERKQDQNEAGAGSSTV